MVRHPRDSYIVYSLLSLDVATAENKSIHSTLSSICKKGRLKSGSFSGMQLNLKATRPTPHGAPRSVQAMSAWSAKTRRAPSRHSRGTKAYGHTTMTMHDTSSFTFPPSPLTGVMAVASVCAVFRGSPLLSPFKASFRRHLVAPPLLLQVDMWEWVLRPILTQLDLQSDEKLPFSTYVRMSFSPEKTGIRPSSPQNV